MDDYIKREDALNTFSNAFYAGLAAKIKAIPSEDVVPVRHEEDGTLWVTVEDCEKVGRVIIKNEQGHFCRVFYMGDGDEEPVRHGRWMPLTDCSNEGIYCSECHKKVYRAEYSNTMKMRSPYCPNCGARMDGDNNAFI